jgi:hypothetical protein
MVQHKNGSAARAKPLNLLATPTDLAGSSNLNALQCQSILKRLIEAKGFLSRVSKPD